MAVNYIKINTSRLNSDLQQIESLIQSMNRELTNMENCLQNMNTMWEGKSKEAFEIACKHDLNNVKEVMKVLQDILKYEENAKNKYEDCERKVMELVDSIQI